MLRGISYRRWSSYFVCSPPYSAVWWMYFILEAVGRFIYTMHTDWIGKVPVNRKERRRVWPPSLLWFVVHENVQYLSAMASLSSFSHIFLLYWCRNEICAFSATNVVVCIFVVGPQEIWRGGLSLLLMFSLYSSISGLILGIEAGWKGSCKGSSQSGFEQENWSISPALSLQLFAKAENNVSVGLLFFSIFIADGILAK